MSTRAPSALPPSAPARRRFKTGPGWLLGRAEQDTWQRRIRNADAQAPTPNLSASNSAPQGEPSLVARLALSQIVSACWGGRRLLLPNIPLPAAYTNRPYGVALAYRGGAAPVRWQIADERDHPDGLNYDNENGYIRGIPINEGTYHIVVTVSDSVGRIASRPYVLLIMGDDIAGDPNPTSVWEKLTRLATFIFLGVFVVCVAWMVSSK